MKIVKEIIEIIFFIVALVVIIPMVLEKFDVKTDVKTKGWQYKIEYISDLEISKLNQIGAKGFEAVSCRRARSGDDRWGYECIFKKSTLNISQ